MHRVLKNVGYVNLIELYTMNRDLNDVGCVYLLHYTVPCDLNDVEYVNLLHYTQYIVA